MGTEHLIIVGASVRAAAFSALRAGLRPWCVDLYADRDLQTRCPVTRIAARDYPRGLVSILNEAPPGPWMYTGALENHREVVRMVSRKRPLWGNDADVLRRVRSPLQVTRVLERAGIPCPRVRQPHRVPHNAQWLAKPVASAGGHGIFHWPNDPRIPRSNERRYLQECIHGTPCAAIFLGDGKCAQLFGVTMQLLRAFWLHARTWNYAGSIGPLDLSPDQRAAFERLGNTLAESFKLCGLFGVDCVFNTFNCDIPYPVEINPRYTASIEVLEYATGVPFLPLHRNVFALSATKPLPPSGPARIPGKAILFAKDDLVFPQDGPWRSTLEHPGDVWDLPAFADIPVAGQRIAMGRPVLTFFAQAATRQDCLDRLQHIAADLDHHLVRQ